MIGERAHRIVAWVAGLLLVGLHLDFWRPQRAILYFGWLPEDIAYRLVWMFFASLYLAYFTRFVWGRKEGREEQ